MKIVLLENLRKLGAIGEIINVKRGYARNFLIPQKKALFASEKNKGNIVKLENWGLMNLSYLIKKNKKGNYIHLKIEANKKTMSELEKNEKIDKNLLRYLTVKVKKFDLKTDYFNKNDEKEIEKFQKNKNEKKK